MLEEAQKALVQILNDAGVKIDGLDSKSFEDLVTIIKTIDGADSEETKPAETKPAAAPEQKGVAI